MSNVTDTPRSRRKRTPKQRVLRRFPNAYAYQGPLDLWAIFGSRFGGPVRYLSNAHRTARRAWAEAERRFYAR